MLRIHTGTCRSGRCRAWAVIAALALTMTGIGIVQGQSLAELQAAAKNKRDPAAALAAQYQLGRRYLLGLGTPADEKEGLRLLKEAADKSNNLEAMHMVAVCYATESGVTKKSERDAFKYFEKAASGGLAEAQFKLGTAYENGLLNLKPDVNLAMKWHLAAAKQGHARAQYKYARLIYQTQDYPAAAEWFRKAAEQGLIEAQVWTGGLYSTGQGVSKDMTEAYKWYLIAARMGHPDAVKKVDQAKASPTYFGEKVITEGQRRAEAYLEQHREREKVP
jgi:TPR repeat protein